MHSYRALPGYKTSEPCPDTRPQGLARIQDLRALPGYKTSGPCPIQDLRALPGYKTSGPRPDTRPQGLARIQDLRALPRYKTSEPCPDTRPQSLARIQDLRALPGYKTSEPCPDTRPQGLARIQDLRACRTHSRSRNSLEDWLYPYTAKPAPFGAGFTELPTDSRRGRRCRRVAGSRTSPCRFLRGAWRALLHASGASRPTRARNRGVR